MMTVFRRVFAWIFFVLAVAAAPACGGEASPSPSSSFSFPLRPGEAPPFPGQRGLDEVHELPTTALSCPVCGFSVPVPLVDKLMRKLPGDPEAEPVFPRWRMHAAMRDSDRCPYPGQNKIAYQADVVVCPSCGYAREADIFANPVPPEAAAWTLANLRPAIREAENAVVGARRHDMNEDELVRWFAADQERIPDTVRTEHWRIYLTAIRAPAAERARANRLAAWASRREAAAPPRGQAMARHAAGLAAELAEAEPGRAEQGLHGDIIALRDMLERMRRRNKEALPGMDDMAGRLMLAGMWDRMGFLDEAEKILVALHAEARERFLRLEQDPLWPATARNGSHTARLNELETIRADAEADILVRLEMVRREREQLLAAAGCLREAFGAGAFDASPDEARFEAYMTGELLRRAGNLPLAAEWFKNLIALSEPGSPLARLAARQLEYVGEEAGDRVNLLSALGQDGELLTRLRRICTGTAETTEQ